METKIFESREIRANVGNVVVTPNGTTFKVVSWTTAKEHGLNTETTALGSRLAVERNGKFETYFNNPSGMAGAGRLSKFYEETGLKVSGQSSTEKEKHFKVANLDLATNEELADLKEQIETLLAERAKAKEEEEKEKLLRTLMQDPEKLKKILESL